MGQHNDWLVEYHGDINITSSQKSKEQYKLEKISKYFNLYRIKTATKISKTELKTILPSSSDIKHLVPNLKLDNRNVAPNDFFFQDQWSMDVIDAEKVWAETTGGQNANGEDIVIAILDDGFDVAHEDLKDNYWFNTVEIPNDGFDNDDNGYIDDVMGVNIQDNTGVHPGVSHGTLVSGIIAAQGDNDIGIAGVNWNTKLLLVSGISTIGEIVKGYEYIYELKKRYIETNGAEGANVVVTNFSGGIKRVFPSDYPTWCDQYDLLGSVGVLSIGAVANEGFNVESEGDMPTLCNSPYLIMVTNTDQSDEKVLDAAFGRFSVDIGAPGEVIISSEIGNTYDNISGTSAAAPHVAGAIGLLYTVACDQLETRIKNNPASAALDIKSSVLNGVEAKESLSSTVSGGRLNIFNSVLKLGEICGNSNLSELEILNITPSLIRLNQMTNLRIEYKIEEIKEHEYFIHDAVGRLILSNTFSPTVFGSREFIISHSDLQNVNEGVYFLSIYDGNNINTKRLAFVR